MPQMFQVLRCFQCFVFQVHQTKKSNKWECKLCGEKQSVKRHYGLGTAQECRGHVQKLNLLRGHVDQSNSNISNDEEYSDEAIIFENVQSPKDNLKFSSKWEKFIEVEEPPVVPNSSNDKIFDSEVVLEIPKKQRKCLNRSIKCKEQTVDNSIKQESKSHSFSNNNQNDTAHFKTRFKDIKINIKDDITPIKEEMSIATTTEANLKSSTIPINKKKSKWDHYLSDSTDKTESTIEDIKKGSTNFFTLNDDYDLDKCLDF